MIEFILTVAVVLVWAVGLRIIWRLFK